MDFISTIIPGNRSLEQIAHDSGLEYRDGFLVHPKDPDNIYNWFFLVWYNYDELFQEHKHQHTEIGIYIYIEDAAKARLEFMKMFPDRYYSIRQANTPYYGKAVEGGHEYDSLGREL